MYLNDLMIFPIFFHLSLSFVIRSSWSKLGSAASLVFASYVGTCSYSYQKTHACASGSSQGWPSTTCSVFPVSQGVLFLPWTYVYSSFAWMCPILPQFHLFLFQHLINPIFPLLGITLFFILAICVCCLLSWFLPTRMPPFPSILQPHHYIILPVLWHIIWFWEIMFLNYYNPAEYP